MTDDLRAEIAKAEQAVRIGGEAASFLQSELVRTFLDDIESRAIDAAMAMPLAQHEERFLALAAAKSVRELKAFMKRAAEQREYNERQLDALWKAAEKAEEQA